MKFEIELDAGDERFNSLVRFLNSNNIECSNPHVLLQCSVIGSTSMTAEKASSEFLQFTNPNQWVSVSERLPDTHCLVLCAKKNGKVYQMSYHHPFDSAKRIFQWWAFGKWLDQHSQVTHWMPLPHPPISKVE